MAENEKDGDGEGKKGSSSTGAISGVCLPASSRRSGGVYLGWSQFGKHEAAGHGAKDARGKTGDAEKYTDGSWMRDLQPITTNLAGTPPAWIRLEAAVALDRKEIPPGRNLQEEVEPCGSSARMSWRARGRFRSRSWGPSGFQSLREDLDERNQYSPSEGESGLIVQSMILE